MKTFVYPVSSPLTRRQLVAWASASGLITALAACSAVPTNNAPATVTHPPDSKKAVLRDLGFVETENGWELNLSGRITFSVNDATLSAEGVRTIHRVATTLLGIGVTRITVDGHTDNQGSLALNQELSERRAETTAQAFVAEGFLLSDITRRGFGFTRPVGDNSTEAGRQLNRRVTIIVSSL